MYGERKNAIREYVQNSFDGIQAAVEAGVLRDRGGKVSLTLSPDKKVLVILDNGVGLPHRIAVNTLTAVGASRKERGRQAGFRGIGRLAGIAFTRTLRFRTKAAGDELETIVEFDCEALRQGMLNSGRKPAADLISACTTFDQKRAVDLMRRAVVDRDRPIAATSAPLRRSHRRGPFAMVLSIRTDSKSGVSAIAWNKHDVAELPWRHSLMNWGHDPLK